MAATAAREQMKEIMEKVYGKFTPQSPGTWVPKKYKENKSRYLWTDAFGVCNFLTLFHETGERQYLDQADALIKNVHDILGKDRDLKNRLDGSTDSMPVRGGLRIGKAEPEGTPDGDGQYFHYLTKWMFALSRMALAKGEPKYNEWAIQLAEAVHPRFVYDTHTQRPRMYWKMSIDLSKPHVPSEGNLDPFDGYVTYRLVREASGRPDVLTKEISDMQQMVQSKFTKYYSDDPLDLGEALWIAHWFPNENWAQHIAQRSLESLGLLYQHGYFNMPEHHRLAFREFGTTIGVQVYPFAESTWKERVKSLHGFWSPRLYKRDSDITPVMFCTSLNPGVFWRNYQQLQIS